MISGAPYRLVMAAITLVGVAIIIFVLLRVVPGDPIAMMISPGASPADIAALRAHYGLDASLPVQFLVWAKNLLRGDFGTSISLHRDVLSILSERLPATLELARRRSGLRGVARRRDGDLCGEPWTIARSRRSSTRRTAFFSPFPISSGPSSSCSCSASLLPFFPMSGRIDPSIDTNFVTPFYLIESLFTFRFTVFFDVLRHMIMPTLALGIPLAAVITRVLKESLREAMVQDYVLLARLKGMSNLRLILQEALRNAIAPTLALTGVQFTFLIGGTVIVERIFSYPGIGNMAIDAVINRDLPLIQGLTLVFGALFIVVNMIVDLMVMKANPRLRHG